MMVCLLFDIHLLFIWCSVFQGAPAGSCLTADIFAHFCMWNWFALGLQIMADTLFRDAEYSSGRQTLAQCLYFYGFQDYFMVDKGLDQVPQGSATAELI
jgi:hypothetical protein